nr:PIN domain-containing protein [uncultured Arsenicibacter sp.]
MIYFDTDVLIHFLVNQDVDKHQLANELYQQAAQQERFFVSLLCLQETAFVLHKLGEKPDNIQAMIQAFLPFQPVAYQIDDLQRGISLAMAIGFQNINDCLHVAMAEKYCQELYTFNKADFKRIQKHSRLKITVL